AILEIKDIRQAASVALKEVRELVADMRAVRIEEELYRVEQILKAAQIKFRINGDKSEIKMPVHSENVISMCLKEAVTNIIKHSEATICRINFYQSEDEFKMTIQDNGVGLDRSKRLNGGNGLKGMQERIEFLNGAIEIESEQGTAIIIKVPLAITHQKGEIGK
ncbi:MAG: ATP-binding protein, partial [Solibacillus sp.]